MFKALACGWARRIGKGELLMVEYHKSSPPLPILLTVTLLRRCGNTHAKSLHASRRACQITLRLQWPVREGDTPGDDLWYPP